MLRIEAILLDGLVWRGWAERADNSLSRCRQSHADELQDFLDLRIGIGSGFDLAVYHQQGKAMRQRPEEERGVRHVPGPSSSAPGSTPSHCAILMPA